MPSVVQAAFMGHTFVVEVIDIIAEVDTCLAKVEAKRTFTKELQQPLVKPSMEQLLQSRLLGMP